jgi:alkylated DNA repair dioxygenase AlkB
MHGIKVEVEPGYWMDYYEHFYTAQEGYALPKMLLAVPMEHPVYLGRPAKRLTAQYGQRYAYSAWRGADDDLHEWSPVMLGIRERMETVVGPLHGGLVQVYPTGEAGIGWHSDAGHPEVIASLSLGAEREFAVGISVGKTCKEVCRLKLAHGSLLTIPGRVNDRYKHRLVEDKRIVEPRINVTLRRFPASK